MNSRLASPYRLQTALSWDILTLHTLHLPHDPLSYQLLRYLRFLAEFRQLVCIQGLPFCSGHTRVLNKKKFTIKLNKPKFIRHEDGVFEILFSKFEDRGAFIVEGGCEGEKEDNEEEKFKIHCFIRVS